MSKEIFSKEPQEFNVKLAEALKKIPEFKIPAWALLVKSGVSRQRVPEDEDFWFKRSASILRQLYLRGVVGVERLRTRHGGRKNRGARPARFKKSSGKIIRTILQQAEKAGLVETIKNDQFGRKLTQKGKDLLDSIKISEKAKIEYSTYIGKAKKIQTEQVEEINYQEDVE